MKILLIILITLLMLEVGLSILDPLGLRYLHELGHVQHQMVAAVPAYRHTEGVYRYRDWSGTVNAAGLRVTPDSGAGPCVLALFGDSVGWGWGVNDSDTYTNQLARMFPDVTTVNYAQIGYNSEHIRRVIAGTSFDVGVYVIVRNDHEATPPFADPSPVGVYTGFGIAYGGPSALWGYAQYLRYATSPAANAYNQADPDRFREDVKTVAERGVILFAFDDPAGQLASDVANVHLLDSYPEPLSAIDWHPNASGHALIAAEMHDVIKDALAVECVV